jgi:hypothetical protein
MQTIVPARWWRPTSGTRTAARLHINHRAAHDHMSNIFAELDVADRAPTIIAARDAGMGRLRPDPGGSSHPAYR